MCPRGLGSRGAGSVHVCKMCVCLELWIDRVFVKMERDEGWIELGGTREGSM